MEKQFQDAFGKKTLFICFDSIRSIYIDLCFNITQYFSSRFLGIHAELMQLLYAGSRSEYEYKVIFIFFVPARNIMNNKIHIAPE